MSVRWLAIALVLALAPGRAAADEPPPSLQGLGSYETAALRRALHLRTLAVEPAPAGKRVGRIHVVNLDVFGPDEAWLRWANFFHITTQEFVIAREVLLEPGEPWDEDRIEETRRRLADPLFTTLVVLAPVRSTEPDLVDLLVVTRDMWSLRMNTKFEFQAQKLSELSMSLSENNLFGLRKQVAFVFDMDLGSYALGPQYVDKNLGGSRLTLLGKWGAIFSRETGDFEGTRSFTSFAYPLWSLDREWGASIVESHFDGVSRLFCGAEVFDYRNLGRRDPVTGERVPCNAPLPDDEPAIPAAYRLRTFSLETSVVRQLGRAVKHRITGGHDLDVVRPRLLDDFPGDPAVGEAFAADLFPRSERRSALFLRYTMFLRRFAVYRNIDSYDLAEDVRLGPEIESKVAVGRELIGSDVDFATGSLGAGWTFDLAGDGFARVSAGASVRRAGGAYSDRVVSGTVASVSPALYGVRLIARGNVSARIRDTNNQFFFVGGNTGLRGYPIGFFRGDRQVVGNLELRTGPERLLFTRVGGVVFWDVGHAADRFEEITLHHDVGIGLRALVPQLQPFVFRFDWAVPLTGVTAGLPGRFTAGVQQAF
jgi:hypothetical protein